MNFAGCFVFEPGQLRLSLQIFQRSAVLRSDGGSFFTNGLYSQFLPLTQNGYKGRTHNSISIRLLFASCVTLFPWRSGAP